MSVPSKAKAIKLANPAQAKSEKGNELGEDESLSFALPAAKTTNQT